MSKPLSPAARAVLTAIGSHPLRAHPLRVNHIADDLVPALAAGLRALADQVAPDEPDYMRAGIHDQGWWDKHDLIRSEILDIVAELEALLLRSWRHYD